jgi:multidrug efflux pump subunit AcrB
VIVAGVLQLRQAPVDVLPEFSPPYVEIQTESLGLSAEEVEQLITVPMEQDLLNGVPWLDTIRSESTPGVSSIVLTFKPGTDLMKARQMVSERMTQAVALPHVSRPPTMLQPNSATGRVLIVRISSKTLSLIQMGVLARWTIVPRLMGVPGVSTVAVWGQRDRQLQVLVDPHKLKAYGLTYAEVAGALGRENQDVPAGKLEQGRQEPLVRVAGKFRSVDGFSRLIVAHRRNTPLIRSHRGRPRRWLAAWRPLTTAASMNRR